jgi:glucose/arabinose dehydrogenase
MALQFRFVVMASVIASCNSNPGVATPYPAAGAAGSGEAQGRDSEPATSAHDAAAGTNTCSGPKLDAFVSDPKLCVTLYAENLANARQMAFAPNGDLFVSAGGRVMVLWDADKNGTSDGNERSTFATNSGLNHGLAFSRDAKFVYASTASTVFRWSYTNGRRTGDGAGEAVVKDIPDGGHSTRTLGFDSKGRLIVNVGSASNVDADQLDWESRSQIRRFEVPEVIPLGGIEYATGEVLASGMRNEVGLFVDTDDRIWGVENGRDNLADDGDIHNDNPAEELNLVDGKEPKFYGYPQCWSEFKLSGGGGPGTQWADETLAPGERKTDEYCRDTTQVRPPVYAMPAHWAPLGIIRYTGRALPMTGDLIIGAHGSWNSEPVAGRLIARAKLSADKVTLLETIVGERDSSGVLKEGTWSARPVDVRQGPDEAVYVSDDEGGRVLKIGYQH